MERASLTFAGLTCLPPATAFKSPRLERFSVSGERPTTKVCLSNAVTVKQTCKQCARSQAPDCSSAYSVDANTVSELDIFQHDRRCYCENPLLRLLVLDK